MVVIGRRTSRSEVEKEGILVKGGQTPESEGSCVVAARMWLKLKRKKGRSNNNNNNKEEEDEGYKCDWLGNYT